MFPCAVLNILKPVLKSLYCRCKHKTRKEVAAKKVAGLVDTNNTKQADETEMGRRTNHSIKPKYREVKRELCQSVYIQIKFLSNSAA